MRAHPRSRGENVSDTNTHAWGGGSSPLTRGKRAGRGNRGCRLGLIPAHAGKTPACGISCVAVRAHPRSRGENGNTLSIRQGGGGSSPLTRGKLRVLDQAKSGRRLIPAHAGKTSTKCAGSLFAWAHPRSRGENTGLTRDIAGTDGSSPLTRGKQCPLSHPPLDRRLIPAHAGKTTRWCAAWPSCPAHPRSRGENARIASLRLRLDGSSPLTRGKQASWGVGLFLGRLIPAHAGKTLYSPFAAAPSPAHPRSRGENPLENAVDA